MLVFTWSGVQVISVHDPVMLCVEGHLLLLVSTWSGVEVFECMIPSCLRGRHPSTACFHLVRC